MFWQFRFHIQLPGADVFTSVYQGLSINPVGCTPPLSIPGAMSEPSPQQSFTPQSPCSPRDQFSPFSSKMVSFLIQYGRYYKGLLIIYRGGMDGFSGGRVQEGAPWCAPPPKKIYISHPQKVFPPHQSKKDHWRGSFN